jgi:hypothetical protein
MAKSQKNGRPNRQNAEIAAPAVKECLLSGGEEVCLKGVLELLFKTKRS